MKRKHMVFAELIAAELLLLISGLGIITNGSLSITVLQIPVILATACLGLPQGLAVAAIFGAGTMLRAQTFSVQTLDRLFVDPLVSVAPRLMIAVAAWGAYRLSRRMIDDHTISSEIISSGMATLMGTSANTVFVMLALCTLHAPALGLEGGASAFGAFATGIIGANSIIELVVSVIVTSLLVPVLKGRRTYYADNANHPVRQTFQKWLIVVVVGAFMLTLISSYALQTARERRNAEDTLDIDLQDMANHLQEDASNLSAVLRESRRSSLLLVREDTIVGASLRGLTGKTLSELELTPSRGPQAAYSATLSGTTYLCKARQTEDALLLAMIPESVAYANRNETAVIMLIVDSVIFLIVFFLISWLLQARVVRQLYNVNQSVSVIQGGDLDESVEERSTKEFNELSDGINAMVGALKASMQQIRLKMSEELELARRIQQSALPVVEQTLPAARPYDIVASMDAAREVGGDFYDFFLIGEEKLGFVIADVSGKGIPAALFMMTSKTLIKSIAQTGRSPAEVLTLANAQLCENNEAEMFVTAWLGVLNVHTGELEFANAGHNPPVLRQTGRESVFMDRRAYKRGPVLGAMDGIVYRNNRISLGQGDTLFLYTDGVTEANDSGCVLYGDARLKSCLDQCWQLSPAGLLAAVRRDVEAFIGDAEQFDDMTMLCLSLCGEAPHADGEASLGST